MSDQADLDRLRAEYADRSARLAHSDRYSLFNTRHLFMVQQRQRQILRLLKREGLMPLDQTRILEVGCGRGEKLLEALSFGAAPDRLYGMDLLPDRLRVAHTLLPHLALACADGQHLPYASGSFDLVMQYTVLSSVLDDTIRQHIAGEMRRVLRSGGLILWYDFWLNPTNPQTRGIRKDEVRRLFPGCHCRFHRITLAPPVARRMAPASWLLAATLEKFRLLNTHYLAAIRPLT